MSATMVLLVATGLVLAVFAAIGIYHVVTTRRIAAMAERIVPATGSFIEIDGNGIHYMEAGSGPPILFLHGLGGQLHHFRHTLFDRLGRHHRVVAIDRPGSGYSVRARGATGKLSEQARAVASIIQALGMERPLVVGHSLGGAVALTTALDHPDRVGGLALLAPLTHYRGEVPPQFKALHVRSPLMRVILAHTVAVPRSLKYAQQTLDFIFGPQPVPEDYRDAAGGFAGLRPSHIIASMTDFTALEDELLRVERRYGELRLPVGILFGTADRVLDHRVEALPLRDRIAGLELDIVEGFGHMPQFSATERVETFIRRMAARTFGTTVTDRRGRTVHPDA